MASTGRDFMKISLGQAKPVRKVPAEPHKPRQVERRIETAREGAKIPARWRGEGVKGVFKCLPRGTIERNVLEAIKRKGMSVKAVSQKTGISVKALYAAFEGRSELQLGYFLTICHALNLDPWEMAGRISA